MGPVAPEAMSLAEVLQAGGTARIGAEDLRSLDLESWAGGHNRSLVQLDTVDCASGKELIDAMREAFAFAEDAASDWDELDEDLGDWDVTPAQGLVVAWSGWDSVAVDDERAMAVAVDVLRTAAQAWCDDGIPWTVLVVGDGPAWDLPWLGAEPAPWDEADDEVDEDADEDADDTGYDREDDSLESLRW